MFNQGAITPEKISYRVAIVTGGITHPVLGALPDKGSFPVPLLGTGIVSTTNTDASNPGLIVTGTGTNFKNDPSATGPGKIHGEIFEGDYICNGAAGAIIRRITKVFSETQLQIEAKFPTNLSGNLYIIRKNPYKMIIARSVGTVAATLQEQSFAINEVFVNGGSPITYDCSSAGAAIDFQLDY